MKPYYKVLVKFQGLKKNSWLETDRCCWPSIACLSCQRYLCINRYNSVNLFIFKDNSNYLHFALSSSSLLSSVVLSTPGNPNAAVACAWNETAQTQTNMICQGLLDSSNRRRWIALRDKLQSLSLVSPNEICMELYEGASQPTSLYERIPPFPLSVPASGDVLRSRCVPALLLPSLTSRSVV